MIYFKIYSSFIPAVQVIFNKNSYSWNHTIFTAKIRISFSRNSKLKKCVCTPDVLDDIVKKTSNKISIKSISTQNTSNLQHLHTSPKQKIPHLTLREMLFTHERKCHARCPRMISACHARATNVNETPLFHPPF